MTSTAPARVLRATVTEELLDVSEHAALVDDAAAGAVVTFAGVVRDHDHGRSVTALDYEGHPSAAAVVEKVAADVAAAFPGVRALAVTHRVGALGIGDVALACAVAAEHRRAGVRRVQRARRRREARAAGVEAPGVHRRHRGMGQLPLSPQLIVSVWPGKIRFGSVATSGLAWASVRQVAPCEAAIELSVSPALTV